MDYYSANICYIINMNEPRKHLANYSSQSQKTSTAWFHLYEMSKIGKTKRQKG